MTLAMGAFQIHIWHRRINLNLLDNNPVAHNTVIPEALYENDPEHQINSQVWTNRTHQPTRWFVLDIVHLTEVWYGQSSTDLGWLISFERSSSHLKMEWSSSSIPCVLTIERFDYTRRILDNLPFDVSTTSTCGTSYSNRTNHWWPVCVTVACLLQTRTMRTEGFGKIIGTASYWILCRLRRYFLNQSNQQLDTSPFQWTPILQSTMTSDYSHWYRKRLG